MATTILGSFFGRSGGGGGVGKGAGWTFVGRTSEFPDVDGLDENNLAEKRPCRGGHGDVNEVPGCKVFRIPRTVTGPPVEDGDASIEEIAPEDAGAPEHMKGMRDQVLVFRYKGKFHAVDNGAIHSGAAQRCPHSSFPLSDGTPFDIEDFGVVLSSGLTCPKHGWSFDLHTGMGDRGNYKLGVWELELRDPSRVGPGPGKDEGDEAAAYQEVWVRRKQRLG